MEKLKAERHEILSDGDIDAETQKYYEEGMKLLQDYCDLDIVESLDNLAV